MFKLLKNQTTLVVLVMLSALTFSSPIAFAGPHGDNGPHGNGGARGGNPHRSHEFRSWPGRSFHYYPALPAGYAAMRIADALYYYAAGLYYQETPAGYIIVDPPAGAVVRVLPSGYKTIVYGGRTYCYYNRAYYLQQSPDQYVVVTPPPAVVTQNPPAVEAPEKTVVVTVPNPNGSYIPVTLKKYSDGYEGPNGEFYKDYPTIDQLKAMYSKPSANVALAEPEQLDFDIPNPNGSFIKVKLTRTKDGYVGPEGEYYPKKPTIDQLKMMYAKD